MIEIIKKLNNGRSWEQVTSSWRTAAVVREIAELMKRLDYKTFHHVRRKGNRAADYLANWGCKGEGSFVDTQWMTLQNNSDWADLTGILNEDHEQASIEVTGGN